MPHSVIDRLRFLPCAQLATLVASIALLLYLPTLQFEFVNWDDDQYVTKNPAFAYSWWDFLHWAFTTFREGNWHPLTWISLKLDHEIWGLNPFGYHLGNVILHAANSFLVVVLMWRLPGLSAAGNDKSGRRLLAFAVGLVFATHPLHVESVAWVSERKDLLYATFYLLSILTWLEWRQKPKGEGRALYFSCLLLFALSLTSKPMAVSLPVVLLLLDLYPLRRAHLGIQLITEKAPFIALALASAVVTVVAQSSADAVAPIGEWSLFDRLGTAARAFFFYIYQVIVPVDLSPLYQLRIVDRSLMVKGIIAGTGVVALHAWAFAGIKKSPGRFVLLTTFTVMLLPTLGIVQVGSQFAADRYMYLSILPLAVGACVLPYRWKEKMAHGPGKYFLVVVVYGLMLSVLTLQQMMHWRNSETLWEKVIEEDFEVPTAHFNLGSHYLAINQLDKAESEWLLTVRLEPKHSWAHNNLGNMHFIRGDLNNALIHYELAVEGDPDNFEAILNYALVLDRLGMIDRARTFYVRFVELAPSKYQEQIELASGRIKQIDATLPP